MYNKVGGSGRIFPRENLNFQNLRNTSFGLLALMFALLQMPSLLNSRRVQSMKIDHRKPIDIINIIDKNQSINIDWFH